MSTARTALVTGGAGFIGSHLVERLAADGWRVRVLDDFSSGREANLADVADDVEIVRGDVRAAKAVAAAVRGVDAVFHLAAIPSVARSVDEPELTDAVNVGGTVALLEAARRAGVGRVVFAASCAVYGDGPELPKHEDLPALPVSPYALQKWVGEAYCRLYARHRGLPTVALRYFNVYGARQNPQGDYAAAVPRFLAACGAGEAPRVFGDGEQTRDFVHVDDVVQANLRAVDAEAAVGHVVNVGSGVETSVNELVAAIAELCGYDGEPVHGPARPGDVPRSVADLGRARSQLGFEPDVDLREGLRRTLAASPSRMKGRGGVAA